MTNHDLELWILDTASEGGHSFRDLRDCIVRISDEVDDVQFLNAVAAMLNAKLIEIFYSPNDGNYFKLSDDEAELSVSNYSSIVNENTENRASYFVEISESGNNSLRSNGIITSGS